LYSKAYYEQAMSDHTFMQTYNSIPSGDDDLLVQQFSRKGFSVDVSTNPDSFMYSAAPESWRQLLTQKMRHVSTGKFYQPNLKLRLSLYAGTHGLFWSMSIMLLFLTLLQLRYYDSTSLMLSSICWLLFSVRAVLFYRTFSIYNKSTHTFSNN